MPVIPNEARIGLWEDPTHNPNAPGTFAIVIGVSRYDHLDGGTGAKADTSYGLGQLTVSALTAFRFFEWLRTGYARGSSPLAKCWLLLAPTAEEKSHEPKLWMPSAAANFAECETAIGEWFLAMRSLHPAVAAQSRAVFFFSGHGLEVATDHQVLLPSDYLRPPLSNVNRAISTRNLYVGLRQLAVQEDLFFLDACRNDHQDLRAMNVEGTAVLNEFSVARGPANLIAPLLYASASGSQAWSPGSPQGGISFYGQALLEGLQGAGGVKLDCDNAACRVMLFDLQPFVEKRVKQLLAARGSTATQSVRLGGSASNLAIAELPPGAGMLFPAAPAMLPPLPPAPVFAPAPASAPASAPSAPLSTPLDATGAFPEVVLELAMPEGVVLAEGDRALEQADVVQEVPLPKADWHPTGADATEVDLVMGGEADLLHTMRSFDLTSGQWLVGPAAVAVKRLGRRDDRRTYQLVLEMSTNAPSWLEITPSQASDRYACVLPGDAYASPLYELELLREEGRVVRFETGLATDGASDLHVKAARLWRRYRALDFTGVEKNERDLRVLEGALAGKMTSPLAATVAAIVLLRARRFDLLHDWVRNLAVNFPERPDGMVLWCQQRRMQEESVDPAEIADLLLAASDHGLPFTSEALGYLAAQVDGLVRELRSARSAGRSRMGRIIELRERLRQALRYFRNDGLFVTFVGPADVVTPELFQA